jgi:hypothetical protein
MRRQAAALSAFFVLAGCTGQEASDRLRHDLPTVEVVDIIHARFPCYSPDFHFYGYRFRLRVQGRYGYGDICMNLSTREWTWVILPGYDLPPLTPGRQ